MMGCGSKRVGSFEFGVALFVASHHGEIQPEPLMRRRVTWVQFNGPFELFFSSYEIIVIKHGGPGQRGVPFSQATVHFKRFLCQPPRLTTTIIRRDIAPPTEYRQAVGQACVSGGIGGILGNGLPEVLDS